MNRSETLDHVKEIITKDRQATHGEAENSFAAIASLWGLYLNQTITPAQVAEMMVLFKMARQMGNPHHADNLQDLIGYAAIAAELRAPVPQNPVAQQPAYSMTIREDECFPDKPVGCVIRRVLIDGTMEYWEKVTNSWVRLG